MFSSILYLFKLDDQLTFCMRLHIINSISQTAITASYLLLLDSQNVLSIYSIDSTAKLLFRTTEFQSDLIKIHSLVSSFIIINSHTQEIFQMDTKPPFDLLKIADLKFEFCSLLSTVESEKSRLYVLSDDQSSLAIYDTNKKTIVYCPMLFNGTTKIKEIFASSTALVFADTNRRVHVCHIDQEMAQITLDADFLERKNSCHILADPSGNKWCLYNMESNFHGEIQLETACDVCCFTEDYKYLFGISSKESLLFMYRVADGQCVEKLFIENLSPLIQVSKDYLVLKRNDELLIILITEKDISSLKRLEATYIL